MTIEEVEGQIAVPGGRLPVLIMRSSGHSLPTVVVLGEIWAVNQQIRRLCRRLADEGFTVVAPDLYRGNGIPPADAQQDALNGSFASFPDVRAIRDCRILLNAMEAGELGTSRNRPCVWGFCMGGRFAHYLAALSGKVAGALNFYGRLDFPRDGLKPFTPLDVCELIQVPYLGVFAEHDALIPLSDVNALQHRLQSAGIEHAIKVFAAHHGFMNETRPAHDPAIAKAAWDLAMNFIRTRGRT